MARSSKKNNICLKTFEEIIIAEDLKESPLTARQIAWLSKQFAARDAEWQSQLAAASVEGRLEGLREADSDARSIAHQYVCADSHRGAAGASAVGGKVRLRIAAIESAKAFLPASVPDACAKCGKPYAIGSHMRGAVRFSHDFESANSRLPGDEKSSSSSPAK